MEYLELTLCNFQKWKDKTIRINRGVNMILGNSGSGKSTFARAIHFCLYGGRKYKLSMNGKNKLSVELKFFTNNEQFSIKRERPSEVLTVTNGDKIYKNNEAQGWIDSKFGTEESWISSSYLAQEKDNFFMSESNARKKELLNQIVFGNCSSIYEPDDILNRCEDKMNSLKKKSSDFTRTIENKQYLIENIVNEYPDASNYEEISDESFEQNKIKIQKADKKIKSLTISIHEKKKRNSLIDKIDKLKNEVKKIDTFDSVDVDKIKEKINLKSKLGKFDSNVLNYDSEVLYNNKRIFEFLFSKGMEQNENPSEFKKRIEDLKIKYQKWLELEEERNRMENENKLIKTRNDSLLERRRHEEDKYKKFINEMNYYNKKVEEKAKLEGQIQALIPEMIDENDDLSYDYISRKIELYKIATNELFCPHCKKGVFYKNSSLIKGNLESEEEQSKIVQLLDKGKMETEKRKKLEKLRIECDRFQLPRMPETVIKPAEVQLEKLIEIPKSKKVSKPEEFEIEIPTLDYKTTLSLLDSLKKIDIFQRLQELSDVDETVNFEMILKNRKEYAEKTNEIETLEKMVSEMECNDENLEEELERYSNRKKELENRSTLYKKINEYLKIEREIEKTKSEQLKVNNQIEELKVFYDDIESMARDSVDDVISSINLELQEICDELFDRPIEISLMTVKELKTVKKEKPTINLSITYNGIVYDSPSDMSGGEKKRISLALLLAFMTVSSSSICILDEVLPSMDAELKKVALKLINRKCSDKFVIHICHGIPPGLHSNIIELN